MRDSEGKVRGFRNSCSEAPHILNVARSGRLSSIQCAVHGLEFELDGRRRGARGAADLTRLDLRLIGDLLFVRAGERRRAAAPGVDPWADFLPASPTRLLGTPSETAIAADWKLVIEQWLELTSSSGSRDADEQSWSARFYRRNLGSTANFSWQRRFLNPNHRVEIRPDGFTILQVLPIGPGRCLMRRYDFTSCEAERAAQAAAYLASRLNPYARRAALAIAESTQEGIVTFGHTAADGVQTAPAVAAFRRELIALVPMMALARPPNEL